MFFKKPYKTTDEFYEAVERLIKLLQGHGFEKEAKKLHGLLHVAWTTSSELIGELMICLETINADLPKDLKKLKNDCHYFAKHHRRILGLK